MLLQRLCVQSTIVSIIDAIVKKRGPAGVSLQVRASTETTTRLPFCRIHLLFLFPP